MVFGTLHNLVFMSDNLSFYTCILGAITRNSQAMAMAPRMHSSLGVFKGMAINIMITLVYVPFNHLATMDHK